MSHKPPAYLQLFDRPRTAGAGPADILIRAAREDDGPRLADLAQLDSQRPLTGAALVAHVGGEPWAALDLETGRAIADPFRPSAGAVRLLRLRAAQLRTGELPVRSGLRRRLLRRAGA